MAREGNRAAVVVVRELTDEAEASETGAICKRAFNAVQVPHLGRMVSCADLEKTCRALRAYINEPEARSPFTLTFTKIYGVVACDGESGRVIGSNFLDQRGEAAAVGPITVDPDVQSSGAGRELMLAVLRKADQDGHKSVRLLQEAYNTVSFSLYAKLGFEPKDQVCMLMGRCRADWPEQTLKLDIRKMTEDDLAPCAALFQRIVGVDRSKELKASLSPSWAAAHDTPLVAVLLDEPADDSAPRQQRIVGYLISATSMGHGVAESEEILARLHYRICQSINDSRRDDDVVLRAIGRLNPKLVEWALGCAGLRLQRLMTMMARGTYEDPRSGAYSPSVLY